MKRLNIGGALLALVLLFAFNASADTVTPDDFGGPYCLSPGFGLATCALGAEYIAGGLLFAPGVATAVFTDPPHAWGGINAAGIVDLLAPVGVSLVGPGTLIPGTTDLLSVEAGFAADGSLLLEVFDLYGNLLASRLNGLDGLGPHGRTLITIAMAGIHSFIVSTPGQDTFGVDQVSFNPITPIPEPGTMLLLGTGLLGLGSTLRKRFS